ncbi:MAG: hypothetical protein HUK02_08370 [Bacteroidaceae bacterium]|nr:hypothetical protein [Bacteroidaceae bacterium]
MQTVLYIHGYASSGATGSAVMLRNILYGLDVEVLSPDVPVNPLEAIAFLHQYVQEHKPHVIVATSMGAMYAEQLRGYARILVNPSFHMAKLLTFRGMGRQEFRNKRADGAKDFKVDKELIAQFREVEQQSFQGITADDKELVWGLFGKNDKNVNCQPDFRKHYGTAHFQVFDGEHYLNDRVMKTAVLPLLRTLLKL